MTQDDYVDYTEEKIFMSGYQYFVRQIPGAAEKVNYHWLQDCPYTSLQQDFGRLEKG